MNKISIIIPAHNEEHRIGDTLREYYHYFKGLQDQEKIDFEILVVLNGCNDNTASVVQQIMVSCGSEIRILDLKEAGKGLAIIAGFKDALSRPNDYIGFVDADMATEPYYFYELYQEIDGHDGVIASRYMPASEIYPSRPLIKKWGRKLIYNQMVRLLFGLRYADAQCGAKLFKRGLIKTVVYQMSEGQWAFDVELLYLAKKHGFDVIEVPTVWTDKVGSKLQTFSSGIGMLRSLWKLKKLHN